MKKVLSVFILLLFFLGVISGDVFARDMVQVKGSDTLVNLVQKLSEEYMNANKGKYIAVTGGGSGTGIAALINNTCDIANASRQIKQKEIDKAESLGIKINRVIVAMDGLSVIVNNKNSVNNLTIEQLGAIFRGEITNWKDLGGKDLPITLYGRQSNSGTFVFFMESVVKGDYSLNMKRMNGNSQIVESVKQDIGGIGYVGVGYVKKSTGILAVNVAKDSNTGYVSPLNAIDVVEGNYPIVRALNQYVNTKSVNKVRDFINFEISEKGQKIVEEQGFFCISKGVVEDNKKAVK